MDSRKFLGKDSPALLQIIHRKEAELLGGAREDEPGKTIQFDTAFEPHYWFDIHTFLREDSSFREAFQEDIFDYQKEFVILGSLGEGVTAGALPIVNDRLVQEQKDTLIVSVFPSVTHSSDALFNAFSSLGLLLIQGSGPVLLLDRARLDDFISVNREGGRLSGDLVPRYLVELLLHKVGIVRDLVKLSRSFRVELYTVLMASGSSLEIYESLRNILDITLEQPLLDFDISTASIIYVLVKAPLRLQGLLTKGFIELEVNSWLKERLGVDVPQICEPMYVDELNDRIDVVILVGGFETNRLFETVKERVSRFDNLINEHGFYDKGVWAKICGTLLPGVEES
ncbi:MAG: hypothetical protein V3S09_06070 [Candidatus Bathyarchaeia archaeon]